MDCCHWIAMLRQYAEERDEFNLVASHPDMAGTSAALLVAEAKFRALAIESDSKCLECLFRSVGPPIHRVTFGDWTRPLLTVRGQFIIKLILKHVVSTANDYSINHRFHMNNVFVDTARRQIYVETPSFEKDGAKIAEFESENVRNIITDICGAEEVPKDVQHLISWLGDVKTWRKSLLSHPCLWSWSRSQAIVSYLVSRCDTGCRSVEPRGCKIENLARGIDLCLPPNCSKWSEYVVALLTERNAPSYFMKCLHHNVIKPDQGGPEEIRFLNENLGILRYASNLLKYGQDQADGRVFHPETTMNIIKLIFPTFVCELLTRLLDSEDEEFVRFLGEGRDHMPWS